MHEENVYADEQRGLFKSKVKEQLFCSSILMLAKNKKRRDLAKGPHTAKEAALAVGGYTGKGTLSGKQMNAEAPTHKIQGLQEQLP